MSTVRHGSRHEELLLAIACGDVSRDEARVREWLERCPTCRKELALQDAIAGDLEGLAREQRAVRADLAAGRQVAGSDRVEPFLRAKLAEYGARQRPWVPLAAAAALMMTTGAAWLARPPHAPTGFDRTLLGEGDFSIEVVPLAHGRFTLTWTAEAPPRGRFEVSCRDRDGGPLDLPSRRTSESRWTPTETEASALPAEFQVEVCVLDAQGQPIQVSSRRVSR